MTNEQLQERCLEFAGIQPFTVSNSNPNEAGNKWRLPGGLVVSNAPDFLTSVDAHIKWTLPKLDHPKMPAYLRIERFGVKYPPPIRVHVICYDRMAKAEAETPAIAICKAIWQLTEKGNV